MVTFRLFSVLCFWYTIVKGEEEKVLFVANAGNYYIINL